MLLTAALYGTEAQADTSLPAATPFAGVDKNYLCWSFCP